MDFERQLSNLVEKSSHHYQNWNILACLDTRLISLLFHLGEITKRLITNHLRSALSVMKNQYAYTPSLGTADVLVKFTDNIIDSIDSK